MELNNPAGRLLKILEKCKAIPRTEKTRDAWAKVLDIESKDRILLVGRVGKVFALADEIAIELGRVEGVDISRYMSWTKYLEIALTSCNFDVAWHDFVSKINEPTLDYLHMASGMLATNRPQPVLAYAELESIYSGAKDIIKEIIAADLPPKMKQYFLDQLRKICTAIEEYQITGSPEVLDIVEATFGKAVLYKEYLDVRETHKSISKFWKFMANTALVVSTVAGGLQIGDYTKKAFPELSAPRVAEIIISKPSSPELSEQISTSG
ncbi:hypothetical protein [Aliivibrio sp. SR45-2]|uniref:hypothetical protein n=1 Tax=Aliivibrio sp. SR45-2 TaxID=2760931 RepID=UPI0015FD802F|nr:hypothetical protein [Aliivibrio sp. SR45-2]MBB1315808.1 hypothetical protein [Aliivibrio sp. SR45-2]